MNRIPDSGEVHAEILMDQNITHAGNIFPGEVRGQRAGRDREIFRGFADDFQLAYHAILDEVRRQKRLIIKVFRVFFDLFDRFENVCQVNRVIAIY